MTAIGRSFFFWIKFRTFAVLLIGFALPLVVAGVLARDWAKETMTFAFMEKAYLLERQVKTNIELAVSLGIPIRDRRVVDTTFDYLARLLDDHREVRFIAVTDNRLDLIFYEGTNKKRLIGILENDRVKEAMTPFRSGRRVGRLVQVADFSIAMSPLDVGSGASGWLLVAADSRRTDGFLAAGLPSLFAAAALVVLIFWQVASFAVGFFFSDRLGQLRQAFNNTREDQTCALQAARRYDELGYLAQLHNTAIAQLQDRYQQLSVYASEVQNAVYDNAVAGRVRLVADEAKRRLGYLESPLYLTSGLSVETQLRLPLFFLSFAAMLLFSSLLNAKAWDTAVSITTLEQVLLSALIAGFFPMLAQALSRILPLCSVRWLLYSALALLFLSILTLEHTVVSGVEQLVVLACVLTLSALAAISAFRAVGRGAETARLWLVLIFGSGGAAAACVEVGLENQLNLEGHLVIAGLLAISTALLTLLLEKNLSPADSRIDGQ